MNLEGAPLFICPQQCRALFQRVGQESEMEQMIIGRNEDDCYAAFRDFVVSILGLSTGTADSYVSYVKGVCKCVARSVDEIVSSRNSMSETIEEVDRSGKADSTKRNYISGLKAYWRFAKGAEYDAKDSERHDSVDNTLFEIRKEVNAFELRVSDSDANFWQRIFDVSIVVLTVVPTLLTMSGITMTVMWFLVMSMLIGFMGLAALLPVLHRPVRQNLELYNHGKKLALGQVSGLNFTPEEKTLLERKCETGVKYLLPVSMALVLVAIVLKALECN